MAIGQQAEYHDITLPEGWTWKRVREERAKWALGPEMVPVVIAGGAVERLSENIITHQPEGGS